MKTKHYIEYLHPGILFSEPSYKEVKTRKAPKNIPSNVFGYRFYSIDTYDATREDGEKFKTSSKPKDTSPWTYFGKILTFKDVEALKKKEPERWSTLYSNMRGNGYERVVQTRFGQCIPLEPKDRVIDDVVPG